MLKLEDGTEGMGLWDKGEQLEIEFNIDFGDSEEEASEQVEPETNEQSISPL